MLQRFAALLLVLPLVAINVPAQGLNTNASKDDWEEINFEFNSSVLVDGFPSMLRLAELLQRNAGYRVMVEGHTDRLGGDDYNTKLGQARANAVRDFLIKYGARANQITVATRGRAAPKYPGQGTTYRRTDEARYMNRRVVLTVMDEQGRVVGEGGPAQAIRAIEPPKPAPPPPAGLTDCCSEVLKRLDRLDDIAKLLQNLANQNADLKKQLDDLKNQQQVLESRVNQPPPRVPTTGEVATAVAEELNKNKEPRFQLLGTNVGADQDGNITFTGRGRFFAPFADHFAFQAQGEYLYSRGQKEGQFDFGLVDRLGRRFQAGLFSSFKHITLAGNQTGGTLGQAAITLDYIFKWGRIGAFGTKGFLDNSLINSAPLTLADGTIRGNVLIQRYLKLVDQAGASATLGLFGKNYLEVNAGYLKSVVFGDRFGGTARFVFPMNDKIAITVEGGINETMLTAGNNGRAVVGVQFSNMMRPKEYLGTTRAIPAEVPRVRYEILTRRLRIGNSPPVADAGPDQIGVPAGPIQLDGSASYDPDGDPITFQWIQEAGPMTGLSNPTGARTSFTAGSGQAYTFRLLVKDDHGGQAFARVHVTTRAVLRPQILSFTANPLQITTGQVSTLGWQVINAVTVNITSVGDVPLTGSRPVSPQQTTTYVLTATGSEGPPVTAQVQIIVTAPAVGQQFCYATPSNIILGESATLNYQFTNATSVTINPGNVTAGSSGTFTVTPTQSTNYTITATGTGGGTASCTVGVTVTKGELPRIIRFSAVPGTIMSGQTSTLLWVVENATKVNISPTVGDVSLGGTQDVSPAATTLYTLTATNAAGAVTATTTVNVIVIEPPKIVSFTATPPTSPKAGAPVVLACKTTGAVSVTMAGILFSIDNAAGGYTVYPTTDTTYTCIATNQSGQTDTQTVAVKVTPPPTPPPNNNPVVVVAGGYNLTTIYRFIYPDASGSYSPLGNAPLTYNWTVQNNAAVIINANSPTPIIEFGLIGGTYLFNLTVTDSKGNSTTQVISILFDNIKVQ
jgi:OmpA family protein/K319-like protein